ncbi:hypothetical protein BGX27_009155 [Mortierella sp. AM989]|nr:hypothetical protein BGX27_009155 [Mortierella sp. AM989]
MKLLAHQPTLTKVCLVGSIGIRARLPLDIILECLPYLAHLEVSQYFCQLSDISHWAVQDCRRQWNRSQTLIKDEMVTETIEINTVESAAILTGTVAAVRPPFALRVLRFSEAFRYLTDYEIFFGALPNLVSLDLHTEVLLSAWRNIEKHLDTSNTPNPWSDAVAARFSKSLIRKCPKLNRILLKDKFSVAMLDLQYNGAGAQSNHDDSRAQFEVSLPKIMRDFRECTFRQSRKSLNWMIQTCGSGLKELNISCSSQEVGTSNTPGDNINSRDLQNILESCPNLTMLMAGGRVLHVRDMAPLSSFLDVSPPHAIRHRDSAQDLPTRTESKPWACTRTLERLEIGIMAETDDPSEHEKAWIQLGQIKNCTAIELSKTNLIPRLSHGLGMLRDIKPLYTFLIKQWEMSESAEVCTDENRPEDETKKRRATLLDSETVAWIAKHWKNLLVLKLDTGGIEELKEEMRALVEREKKDGRMRIVRLLLT